MRMAPISALDRLRRRPAHGVGELDALELEARQLGLVERQLHALQDQLGRQLALVVAAEGAEDDAPFDGHAAVLEGLERHALLDHGVGHRLADVLAREGVRGGDAHAAVDMQRPAQRALEALLVEPQGAVLDAGLALDRWPPLPRRRPWSARAWG